MEEYIKLFQTHTAYINYRNSEDYLKPNISYCKDLGDMHYNWDDPRIIAKFNVTSTSSKTSIMYSSAISQFSEIEIDGIIQPSVVASYKFSTTGEHIVKYTLIDNTKISNNLFFMCSRITSMIIPNSVTSIGQQAFWGCDYLTSVNIPNFVTSIGYQAFANCSFTSITIPESVTNIDGGAFSNCNSITSIICNAMTAPTIKNDTFRNIKTGGTLIVPVGSTGYDVWMDTGNYYLGQSNWTKIEQ